MQIVRGKVANVDNNIFIWPSIIIGILAMLGCGTLYGISAWAPSLKSDLQYTQTEVNAIASVGNIGSAIGILPGILFDKFGPIPVAAVSSVCIFAGYFLIYESFSLKPHFMLFMLFYFLVGLGSIGSYTASLSTNIRNVNVKRRGMVVGVLVSALGLSSAIFTAILKEGFLKRGSTISQYMLMCSILIAALIMLSALLLSYPAVQKTKFLRKYLKPRFKYGRDGLISSAPPNLRATIDSIEGVKTDIQHKEEKSKSTIFAPDKEPDDPKNPPKDSPKHPRASIDLGMLEELHNLNSEYEQSLEKKESPKAESHSKETKTPKEKRKESPKDKRANADVTLTISKENEGEKCEAESHEVNMKIDPNNITGLAMIKTPAFWLFFFMLILGTASGLLFINTLSSIYLSRGGQSGGQNISVLLLSVMNAFGRLSLGILSDRFVHRVKRAVFALGAYAVLMISYIILISTTGTEVILPVSLLVGYSYGGLYCLIPTMVADLFGVQSFAKNWGSLTLFNSVGALIYGLIAGAIYDHQKDGADSCLGHACYWPTYVMCMVGITIASICCFVLLRYLPNPNLKKEKRVAFKSQAHHKQLFKFNFLEPHHMTETFKDVLMLASKLHLFEHRESEHHRKHDVPNQLSIEAPKVQSQDLRNSITVEETEKNKEITNGNPSVHKNDALTEEAQ